MASNRLKCDCSTPLTVSARPEVAGKAESLVLTGIDNCVSRPNGLQFVFASDISRHCCTQSDMSRHRIRSARQSLQEPTRGGALLSCETDRPRAYKR